MLEYYIFIPELGVQKIHETDDLEPVDISVSLRHFGTWRHDHLLLRLTLTNMRHSLLMLNLQLNLNGN